MNSPAVDIAVVAWPLSPARFKYCRLVIESMLALLTASRHPMRFVVSIGRERDPNRKWHGTELEDYLNSVGLEYHYRTRRQIERLGYAMNETVNLCQADYALLVQDDRPLLRPLDISDAVDLMEQDSTIDLIRFGWSTGKNKAISTIPYCGRWRRVRIGGRWPYSDAPHLRRHSFTNKFGIFDETTKHGVSETDMMRRCRNRKAIILVQGVWPYFGNICGEPAAFREASRKAKLKDLRENQ